MTESGPSSTRVLVVGDDPAATDGVARGLEAAVGGLTAVAAPTADRALTVIEDDPVDCVVAGFDPGSEPGAAFLAAVEDRWLDLPVLVVDRTTDPPDWTPERAATERVEMADGDCGPLADRVVAAVERYRRIEALERDTTLLSAVQEQAAVGGWEYVPELETVRWTDGVRRIHGVDPDYEPTLEEAIEFYLSEDRDRIERAVERALETGESYDMELRIRTADGQVRWVRSRGERLADSRGREVLRGSIEDVTTAKRHRQQLQDHKETIEALHRAAPDIAGASSPEAVAELTVEAAKGLLDFTICSVLYYEEGWLEPVAVSEDSPEGGVRRVPVDEPGSGGLAGKTYRERQSFFVEDVDEDDTSDPASRRYRSGLSIPIGDHGVFQAAATEPNEFDDRDVELGELLVAHADSALDNLEKAEALRRRNERLDQFARIVSHDLRNPIEAARGYVELARQSGSLDSLDDLERVLSRMETIVDDVLTVAGGDVAVEDSVPVDLGTVAERSWSSVGTEDGTLTVVDSTAVKADADRLERLFENLFRNSIEHGSPSVAVEVGSLPDGFYVQDDGPGIPDDVVEEVFEEGVSTNQGAGLGLFIVQQVARAHGWTVAAATGTDGGARFEVTGVETLD